MFGKYVHPCDKRSTVSYSSIMRIKFMVEIYENS